MAELDEYGRLIDPNQYDFNTAARRRVSQIENNGRVLGAYDKYKSNIEKSKAAFDEDMRLKRAGLDSMVAGSQNADSLRQYGADLMGRVNAESESYGMGQVAYRAGNNIANFINAIGMKESNNNYSARNSQSGALGKYQIMPSNIAQWSRQALGHSVTPMQFLASPQIQEKVAQYKLSEYYNKFGVAGAAIAWYAGPAAAQRYASTGYASQRTEYGGYPSIYSYALAIQRQMGLLR